MVDKAHVDRAAVAHIALVMVGFLLGGQLTLAMLRERGRAVFWISVSAVVVAACMEFTGLVVVRIPLAVAPVLAGIAPATDPVATVDVMHEAKADGPFVRTLVGFVAIDMVIGSRCAVLAQLARLVERVVHGKCDRCNTCRKCAYGTKTAPEYS